MNARTTTDLEVIRNRPHRFTWGRVLAVHDIGPYSLVEHEQPSGKVMFHVYVDGKDMSNCAPTLDGAIVLAIAQKRMDPNEARYMAMAAAKILAVEDK